MGVARQIVQYMLGASKRGLGVDNPILTEECAKESAEGFPSFQGLQRTGQTEISFLECLLQPGDELAAEDPAEDLHRKKEGIPWVNPTFVIRRQTAGRDYAMDMGVEQQILSPCVKNAQETDLGTEVLGVGCDFQ